MPTTTLPLLLLLFLFSSNAAYSSSTLSRRILHQPFFPVEPSSTSTSSPPAHPPSPTPVSKYPFSGSTPDDTPFFPSDHPPPSLPSPSPPPPSTSSFPANISSLIFPHSPSSHKSFSGKLILVTVGLSLSAAVISAVALLFFCRSHRPYAGEKEDSPANAPPTPPLPQLRKPSNNSSEFLYLGTLVNASAAINGGEGGGARRGASGSRKLQSPELHPLPPLSSSRQQQQQLDQEYQAQAENNNGGNERRNSDIASTSSETSSMTNSSGSSARSASISISPPMSNSPKNNRLNPNPKYSPEFVELQVQYPVAASPPLPEMSFSPQSIKEAEDEAEESPLLSNSSSSIRITSPVRLSPAERDWGVLGRASPPLSSTSTPTRKPSLKLPAFIGGRRNSSQWASATNSPLSLPSPISSGASSPLSNSSAGNTLRLSVSAGNTPRLSFSGCFSPRLSNLSVGKGSSAKISPFTPPLPPPPPLPPVAKPVAVEKLAAESPIEGTPLRPRLKPLHWDKVRASSDIEMVWDQLRASSFKLNEDMIETLFTVNAPNPNQKDMSRKHFQHSQMQENRVLDPKKAQNIAILLRAVNVTMEEVCEALLDGNVDTLGTELLECLLRMAPTKEEERKLKEYKDDSPFQLGQAEKFLKAVIEIPFAFKRVEAMLYIVNFESEVEYLNKSFETLEAACDELRNSRMFVKLLEAVLKTGNRMNVGTNRGDAHAFKLDTLLKLVDIKGADGKTTLLHFVVQEIIRTEGQRFFSSNDEAKCRKLGLQVVSNISSELTNVKKAAAMDFNALINDVERLTLGLANIGEMVRLNEQIHLQEPKKRFSESMNKFMKMAEQEITGVKTLESVAISLVKEITEYFHGNSAKEEAHPFRIFTVVRDFLAIVDRVCKEVNITINEQNKTSSAHRYPAPLHPTLPIPVKPLPPQHWPGFADTRQSSFSEDDGSPYC